MQNAELNKKFDELFSSEDIEEQFFEWHKKKVEERDKRTMFQKSLPLLIIVAIFISAVSFLVYTQRDRVVQKVLTMDSGEIYFITTVWVDQKIIDQWHVRAELLTDSIKMQHKKQAETLLKTFK